MKVSIDITLASNILINMHFVRSLTILFREGTCQGATYTVNIIEKLGGTGRTERDAMDNIKERRPRKSRELFWVFELRTVCLFGLNDRIGDKWITENTHYSVFYQISYITEKV